jgi:hypothetical protein
MPERKGGVVSMGKFGGSWLGLILVFGGLLAGCGGETGEGRIGAPTQTVRQLKEWPQGLEPTGGGFRTVDMPAQAKKNLVEASPEAEGSRTYFETLRQQ